jgi:hypothetical protein
MPTSEGTDYTAELSETWTSDSECDESKDDTPRGPSRRKSISGPTISDPIVLALIDWGCSQEFDDALSGWMKDHAE